MRLRCDDEVSLRASSELLRLLNLSNAPSDDLRKSGLDLSLLATETADESGPFELARPTGADRVLSLVDWPNMDPMLLRRSDEAIADGARMRFGRAEGSAQVKSDMGCVKRACPYRARGRRSCLWGNSDVSSMSGRERRVAVAVAVKKMGDQARRCRDQANKSARLGRLMKRSGHLISFKGS